MMYKLTPNNKTEFFFKKTGKVFVIDAEGAVLGRLASFVASFIRGKTYSTYTPNGNCSDSLVIINSDKLVVTGNKMNKIYYHHTGFPGGLKSRFLKNMLRSERPEELVKLATSRMLNRRPLFDQQLKSVRFYNSWDSFDSSVYTKIDLKSKDSKIFKC